MLEMEKARLFFPQRVSDEDKEDVVVVVVVVVRSLLLESRFRYADILTHFKNNLCPNICKFTKMISSEFVFAFLSKLDVLPTLMSDWK